MNSEDEKTKVRNDAWNRTFYGSPTIGGFIVFGSIAGVIIYQWLFG
ncbi:hypothetical protein RKD52_002965 [Metabacillus sp. SLBN-84]